MRIIYIKFGGNIEKYEYCYKFEIKYCDTIVLTYPFNYTVVVVHDLPRQDSVLRRARMIHCRQLYYILGCGKITDVETFSFS